MSKRLSIKKSSPGIQYLALLRGINVGGNNIIKMSDIKASFEAMKFSDVVTYIQSGNIVFKSDEKDKTKLTDKIERILSKKFNYTAKAVIISYIELKNIIRQAPKDFGKKPAEYRYDVIFLKDPLTPKAAMKNIKVREGVDNAYVGKKVLYFSRLTARASQSYLNKVASLPEYKFMTIRNWNTTIKLFELVKNKTNN